MASDAPWSGLRPNFEGMHYRRFVRDVVQKAGARSYLEIGVAQGKCLAAIECDAIGVDPAFAFTVSPMGPKRRLHLFQMTSDAFFREHDPRLIFGSAVDVSFLDGLHHFEALLRDFMNAERASSRRSTIMLDDCFPANLEMAARETSSEARRDPALANWWTGDVWKVLLILREYRPDLRLTCVDTFPTGNVLITRLDPQSETLEQNYDTIVERYMTLELTQRRFDDLYASSRLEPAAEVLKSFAIDVA